MYRIDSLFKIKISIVQMTERQKSCLHMNSRKSKGAEMILRAI